jgi:hypothetical protein
LLLPGLLGFFLAVMTTVMPFKPAPQSRCDIRSPVRLVVFGSV